MWPPFFCFYPAQFYLLTEQFVVRARQRYPETVTTIIIRRSGLDSRDYKFQKNEH